jgi:Family of unknown function (DUF6267)
MFINQILTEAPKVGRAFQHLEDLVLIDGSVGAQNAINKLADISRNPQQIRWKWDGKPQVYWGREPDGKFIMVGHNGWLKKTIDGKSQSPGELARFIMQTGKAETPEEIANRQRFATEFASLWSLFEAATPSDFRGYVYGDLLFMARPKLQNGAYSFTPNNVTYTVSSTSELGQRISKATAAVVGHAYFPQFGMGDDEQQPISDFSPFNKTAGLIVLGPRYAASQPQIDTTALNNLQKYVATNKNSIDNFLNDQNLTAMKMSGFKGILYNFNNQMARSGTTTGLANKFLEWLPSSRQSVPMQNKITEWVTKNQRGFLATFNVLENLRAIKDNIIAQLDAETGDIQQTTKGEAGGEGYVVYGKTGEPNVKLVPRHRWTPN